MNTLLLLKEIYVQAFRNLSNLILRRYFQAFSWFCFVLFLVAVYALAFRMSTGFAFD